ncbi:unnamed protein product [Spirodela intermedia]|uniref:Uncharacterized protein n=1 Tax=Spirodela intermedia TaxID=51605 RepID=A0A7I8JEI8_SPIIN|nr:unnamed protein product [Spirodela intermedia]CAA6667943.1 unnamed protein product [Spirodela intermedia]
MVAHWRSYLPGRGLWVINKAHGLAVRPPLHSGGAPGYHLPKWESGRHNLCQRGPAFARPSQSQTVNL